MPSKRKSTHKSKKRYSRKSRRKYGGAPKAESYFGSRRSGPVIPSSEYISEPKSHFGSRRPDGIEPYHGMNKRVMPDTPENQRLATILGPGEYIRMEDGRYRCATKEESHQALTEERSKLIALGFVAILL